MNHAEEGVKADVTCDIVRVYSADGCNENTGNYYDVPPTVEGCYAQQVQSVKFLL